MAVVRAAIVLCCLAILFAQIWDGELFTWGFGLSSALLPCLLMALGAARSGRWGRASAGLLALIALLLSSAMAGIVWLADSPADGPSHLPWATWFLLGGMGLAPLLVVGLGYALTFRRHGLTDDDLETARSMESEEA